MHLSDDENKISTFIRSAGFDPSTLTKELRKKSVQIMTLKERCEHINRLCIPYGVVRCTPNLLLKKWLGIELRAVVGIGNARMLQISEQTDVKSQTGIDEPSDFLLKSSFHISHIKDGEAYDYGFIIGNDFDQLDEIIIEDVVDLSIYNNDYNIGIGPKFFENSLAKGGYHVRFL